MVFKRNYQVNMPSFNVCSAEDYLRKKRHDTGLHLYLRRSINEINLQKWSNKEDRTTHTA